MEGHTATHLESKGSLFLPPLDILAAMQSFHGMLLLHFRGGLLHKNLTQTFK